MSYIDRRTGAQFYGLDHVTGTYKTKRFEKEGREELRLKSEYPRDDSYIFTRDWVFESPEVEYADIFYQKRFIMEKENRISMFFGEIDATVDLEVID